MDRSKRKDYEWLYQRGKNAYECLGVETSASLEQIKKAYRRKALALHPDKNLNNNTEEEFREVGISYTILSDPELKKIYDDEQQKPRQSVDVDSKVSKFKSDLKRNETQFKNDKNSDLKRQQKIEFLTKRFDDYIREENLKPVVTSTTEHLTTNVFPRIVQLKWKNKQSVKFDESLILKLTSVFCPGGKVRLSDTNNVDDRYHFATIEFDSPVSAAVIANHDFSTTSDYWDDLGLRKIASLLRSATLVGYDTVNTANVNHKTLSSLDYIAFTMMDLKH